MTHSEDTTSPKIQSNRINCRFRLPPGNLAGASDMQTLKAWAEKYPELRPCRIADWEWVDIRICRECEHNLDNINAEQA